MDHLLPDLYVAASHHSVLSDNVSSAGRHFWMLKVVTCHSLENYLVLCIVLVAVWYLPISVLFAHWNISLARVELCLSTLSKPPSQPRGQAQSRCSISLGQRGTFLSSLTNPGLLLILSFIVFLFIYPVDRKEWQKSIFAKSGDKSKEIK